MHDRKRIKEAREQFLSGIGVPERLPFKPDPFQLQAIEALEAGIDTLVIAPTGAGKTYIAVEGIRSAVNRGGRAVYTAPLKALSNAKYAEFKKKFEPEHTVGLLTGDRKIDGDASVVVATTEIYRNELYSSRSEYSLGVLDELHYLADPQRGPVWEESIILSARDATLLMLSASISNPGEVAEWIESVRNKPVQIITVEKRPVELRYGFLHPELGVIPLEEEEGRIMPEVSRFYGQGQRGDFREFRGRRGRRFGR
jgi:superfamily II RNA helicase